MDLSAPGAELLGSNEAAALHVLSRLSTPIPGREVARLAECAPSSIRRALERLERIGLVRAAAARHAVLYEVNRDHLLWPPVEAILTAPAQLRSVVERLVAAPDANGATVALFGSVARGDSSPSSDVDLFVVFPDEEADADRDELVDELTVGVERVTGNTVQVVAATRRQLQTMALAGDPLIESLVSDARTLVGPSLLDLIRSLRAAAA